MAVPISAPISAPASSSGASYLSGIFTTSGLLKFVSMLIKSDRINPVHNTVLVIRPYFNFDLNPDLNEALWKLELNHPDKRIKPASAFFAHLALRYSGVFGEVYESKKRPGESVKKIIRPASYFYPSEFKNSIENLSFFWESVIKEFMTFCQFYPDEAVQKISTKISQKICLEVHSHSEGTDFTTGRCAARMTLKDLGLYNLDQYCALPCSLMRSSNFFEKYAFVFSILGDLLKQLGGVKIAHLDIKEDNMIIKPSKDTLELPLAYLADFGGSLPLDLLAGDTRPRSTYPDIRAAVFETPSHEQVDAWSLGVSILNSLNLPGVYYYFSFFLRPIEQLLTTEKAHKRSVSQEDLETLTHGFECEFKKWSKNFKDRLIRDLDLAGTHASAPLLKTHWIGAIEIILWLTEVERIKRLPIELFEPMGGYLKSFSAVLWSERTKVMLSTAALDPVVFDLPIPQALINRLARLYSEDLFSPKNPSGFLKFSMKAFSRDAVSAVFGFGGAGAAAGSASSASSGVEVQAVF